MDLLIQDLEAQALSPDLDLDQVSRASAAETGRRLGQWLSRTRQLGTGGLFEEARYFLPIPVALVQVVSEGERPALAGRTKKLATSPDPLDQIGAKLLSTCLRDDRVSLADTIEAARSLGRPEDDGYAALQRLSRPSSANLVRYFIEHSTEGTHFLSPEDVLGKFSSLRGAREELFAWMGTVEVVWAPPAFGATILGDDR